MTFSLMSAPLSAFSATGTVPGGNQPAQPGAPGSGMVPGANQQQSSTHIPGTPSSYNLQNPLKVNSIEDFLKLLITILLVFATPIIVFFIIYSGFLFVTAAGNETKLAKAKAALLWTIVGAVILLGANALLTIIINTVKQLTP